MNTPAPHGGRGVGWVAVQFTLMAAVLAVGFFDAKARLEEQWLRQKYPAYEDYAPRVTRFIPGLY